MSNRNLIVAIIVLAVVVQIVESNLGDDAASALVIALLLGIAAMRSNGIARFANDISARVK